MFVTFENGFTCTCELENRSKSGDEISLAVKDKTLDELLGGLIQCGAAQIEGIPDFTKFRNVAVKNDELFIVLISGAVTEGHKEGSSK